MSAQVRSCKMDKVTFIEIETLGGVQEHALIANADKSFTSMLKSTYDEQQTANEAKTI